MISNHIGVLGKSMNDLRPFMIIFIIMGDFNADPPPPPPPPLVNDIKGFCDIYNLKNFIKDPTCCDIYNLKTLVKDPTCYKNMANPTCIDLILTNRKFLFHNNQNN